MDDQDDEAVASPVRRQLEAFNARDIDAFMACWTDDCEYYGFPGELLACGLPAVRARHIERFRETHLQGALITRMVAADLVIDHQILTRTLENGPSEVDVVAIYQVRDGLIAKAWFKVGPPRLALVREGMILFD